MKKDLSGHEILHRYKFISSLIKYLRSALIEAILTDIHRFSWGESFFLAFSPQYFLLTAPGESKYFFIA
jgi:hypothetical protein